MSDTLNHLGDSVRDYLPRAVGALITLIIGWIIAVIVSRIIRAALRRSGLDARLNRAMGDGGGVSASELISQGAFWLILLIAVVAALQALQLTIVTAPLNALLSLLLLYIPRILGAALLLLIAWIVARVVRSVLVGALRAARVDERLSGETPAGAGAATRARQPVALSQSIGEVAYWLVFLLFLPPILNALQLPGIEEPVRNLISKFLNFIPNLVAAALIIAIGWFVARLVGRIVANLLAAAGVNRLGERLGLSRATGSQQLSDVLGLLVYVLILLPVIVAGLNALQLSAVSDPASAMLNSILQAIPRILGAAVILGISYVIARLVAGLVVSLLQGFGFDSILERLGINVTRGADAPTPSAIAGYGVLAAIMLFGLIEAANVLAFPQVTELISNFTVLAGRILLAVVIFAVGLWLANLAARTIRGSNTQQPGLLAEAARAAILILVGGMALREMGLANEIVNLAFGLSLGAVAVAVAIAFGWGGRDVAHDELQRWVENRRTSAASTRLELPPSSETTPSGGPGGDS